MAKHEIAERGYAAASMRDIAEAAGLLAGSLYSHFRSKAELVRDIVSKFYDELIPGQRSVLDLELSGAEKFNEMIKVVFSICADHSDELRILHYDWATLSTLDELVEIRPRSQETLDLWRTVILEGQKDGSIVAALDADILVRMTTSSIHALLDSIRYSDRPLRTQAKTDLATSLQNVLVGGVATIHPVVKEVKSAPRRSTRSVSVEGK